VGLGISERASVQSGYRLGTGRPPNPSSSRSEDYGLIRKRPAQRAGRFLRPRRRTVKGRRWRRPNRRPSPLQTAQAKATTAARPDTLSGPRTDEAPLTQPRGFTRKTRRIVIARRQYCPGGGLLVRKDPGIYSCSLCGAVLGIPEGTNVRTLIEGVSDEPSERVIYVRGNEIHRCSVTGMKD